VELLIVGREDKLGSTLRAGQTSVLIHCFHLFLSQRPVRAGRTPGTSRGPALPARLLSVVYTTDAKMSACKPKTVVSHYFGRV
jgi:hypothetical protein